MKHDINDAAVRHLAVAHLATLLRAWRTAKTRDAARSAMYRQAIQGCECGIQALGGDPDCDAAMPKEKP